MEIIADIIINFMRKAWSLTLATATAVSCSRS